MLDIMPCKDCKKRQVGCHSDCEKYLKAKKILEIKKLKKRLEQQQERDYWATTVVRRKKKD